MLLSDSTASSSSEQKIELLPGIQTLVDEYGKKKADKFNKKERHKAVLKSLTDLKDKGEYPEDCLNHFTKSYPNDPVTAKELMDSDLNKRIREATANLAKTNDTLKLLDEKFLKDWKETFDEGFKYRKFPPNIEVYNRAINASVIQVFESKLSTNKVSKLKETEKKEKEKKKAEELKMKAAAPKTLTDREFNKMSNIQKEQAKQIKQLQKLISTSLKVNGSPGSEKEQKKTPKAQKLEGPKHKKGKGKGKN